HFFQPRLATLPAEADQKVGRRGKRIGNALDQVAAAVAVEVDGVLEVIGGGKLHAAEFAGPVANHVFHALVAALDDAQRIEQLLPEEIRPPAIIGERCDRAQNVVLAEVRPEIAFQTPESCQHRGGHAVLLLDLREERPVLLHLVLPGGNAAATDHAIGKLQERLVEDRLAMVAPDNGRVEDHARRRRRDHPRRNALCGSLLLAILEPALVAAVGAAGRGGNSVLREQGSEGADCCCKYRFSHRSPTHVFEGLSTKSANAGRGSSGIADNRPLSFRKASGSIAATRWLAEILGLLDRG